MTTRDTAPKGAPCWADLWTSDIEGSRRFYSELFGWEALEPSAEFGGYFMFSRNGVPVAGGMGDMGPEMPADNSWKVYLQTDDIERTAKAATAAGAALAFPPMAVADLGSQCVLSDPEGAVLGAWQPDTFPGFTVLDEHGAPSWFELQTRNYADAVEFYRSVFGWQIDTIGDSDEFRYSVMRDPSGEGQLAGIMDASGFLPEGTPSFWGIYFKVDDVDQSIERALSLGGAVLRPALDTPYGRLAGLADPAGAPFNLRS